MKILLLYLQTPYPPHSGGKIRRQEILRFLAQRHQVTLVCFGAFDAAEAPEPLTALCSGITVVKHPGALAPQDLQLGKSLPGPAKQYCTVAMAQAIEAVARHSFDVVLVDTLYMSAYRDLLPAQTVLLEQNIESQLYKQYPGTQSERPDTMPNAAWRMMALHENRVWNTFPLRVTVSRADKQEMDRRCSTGRTIVVENGVDLATHPLLPINEARTIVFTGAFDYFPNVDAALFLCREIMPHLWQTAPAVTLILAGSHVGSELLDLSADPRVRVIADPADMETVARRVSIALVPLRLGSGTRLKILEAFAWGLPVVTTSRGCSGLDVEHGVDLLMEDDPAAFAAAVLRLWAEPTLYAILRGNARRKVEEAHDWQPILARLDAELRTFAQAQNPD